MSFTTTNGSAPSKVISPSKLAHIVLRTNKFLQMRQYYKTFLGGHAVFESDHICFITYDNEHHRIALINLPHLVNNAGNTAGLEHAAFTFDSLKDLCAAYKQRKAFGITPGWCVNHGPTISMYYQDPDGNRLETQVDCFDDPAQATEIMMNEAFAENIVGADFDPEELCAQVEAGVDEKALKLRRDVGPRGLEDIQKALDQLAARSTVGV